MEIFDTMSGISYNYYLKFDEKINQFLIFLVHVQHSEKILSKDQYKIFEFAKEISVKISAETKKYFSNRSDYNILEKNKELEERYNDVKNEIDEMINRYRVIIDGKKLFCLENIIETLTLQNRNVYLTPMDVSNLFLYREFDRNKKIDEKSKKVLEDLEKKQDMELEELKIKTFTNLLNGNNKENINPELFYRINRKIIIETPVKDIEYSEGNREEDKLTYGVHFIKNQKEFSVIEKRDGVFIKYIVNIIDRDKEFAMYIQGKIKIDEQEETFKINEHYLNKQFEAVLNGYRLKKLFEIFNTLFIEKYRNNTDKEEKRNKIDDYLSGRIVR